MTKALTSAHTHFRVQHIHLNKHIIPNKIHRSCPIFLSNTSPQLAFNPKQNTSLLSPSKIMTTLSSELVFIPSPGAGHLPPTVELARLLLDRDNRLSITIIIMNIFLGENKNTETPTSTTRLRFIDIPCDESTMTLISPNTFLSSFVEYNKSHVRNIIRDIIESNSVRLAGFVVDMFCVAMTDVANEFESPTYIYFTSSASMLGLMFYLQVKFDDEEYDVTELKDSGSELFVPSYLNPVPAKVLPDVVLDKEGGSKMFLDLAKRFRESKGIIVNTVQELESHGVDYLLSSNTNIPPVFPVGPILNMKNTSNDSNTNKIMTWLNDQPESSVVFLCFGSMGSFSEIQVKEIAIAIERSGERFLWSLRRPPPKEKSFEYPKEYENFEEILPKGFLERTSSVGMVIGWAPQMAVLSHPSVGGFVSHCGWNSTLESISCGVPIAAWPMYAEQQMNAFQLVVDLGMAAEIRIDYRSKTRTSGSVILVMAEEIEGGIRRLMSDGDMRNKVKEMKEKSKFAGLKGGSSYESIGRFINLVMHD